jgi:hypothetical protein
MAMFSKVSPPRAAKDRPAKFAKGSKIARVAWRSSNPWRTSLGDLSTNLDRPGAMAAADAALLTGGQDAQKLIELQGSREDFGQGGQGTVLAVCVDDSRTEVRAGGWAALFKSAKNACNG